MFIETLLSRCSPFHLRGKKGHSGKGKSVSFTVVEAVRCTLFGGSKEVPVLQEVCGSRSQCFLPSPLLVLLFDLVRKVSLSCSQMRSYRAWVKGSIRHGWLWQWHSLTKLPSPQLNKSGEKTTVILQQWKQRRILWEFRRKVWETKKNDLSI